MLTVLYKYWPRIYARVVEDMHHIGLALVPIICDRLLWVALLALIVFLALAAIQVILTGGEVG